MTFLEPAPADRIVASGDTVDVLVTVEGGSADKVILETTEEGGDAEAIKLSRREGNRYAGAITVNRLDVRYRVRAKGTITRFHTLESRPRPEVLEFAKIYRLPEYTGMPDRTVREDHGDLSALEGSKVDLELKVNQKIAKGGLRLTSTGAKVEDSSWFHSRRRRMVSCAAASRWRWVSDVSGRTGGRRERIHEQVQSGL